VIPVHLTLDGQLVEDLPLEAPWPHFERGDFDRQIGRPSSLRSQRVIQASALQGVCRVIRLEGRVFPVLLEGGAERVEEVALLNG
jgi:hypothetical protein